MKRTTREEMEREVAALLRDPDQARRFARAVDVAMDYYEHAFVPFHDEKPYLRSEVDELAKAAEKFAAALAAAPFRVQVFADQGAALAAVDDDKPAAPRKGLRFDFIGLQDTAENLARALRTIRDDVPELTKPEHRNDPRNRLIAMLARDYEAITGRRAKCSRDATFTRLVRAAVAYRGPKPLMGNPKDNTPPDYKSWVEDALSRGELFSSASKKSD
jgi:hypothetical protein